MAEFDGSLKFDTSLDNEGFEKGSEKLLKAIENLTAAVNQMGANMQQSFNRAGGSVRAVANAASKGADEAAAAVARYDAALEKQTQKINEQKAAMADYFAEVKQANEFANAIKTSGAGLDTDAEEYRIKRLDEIDEKYSKQIAKLKELENKYWEIAGAARAAQSEEQPEHLLTDQLKPVADAFEGLIQRIPVIFKKSLVDMVGSVIVFKEALQQELPESFYPIEAFIDAISPAIERIKPTFLELGHAINVGFGELNAGIKSGVISALETFGNVARSAFLGIANLSAKAVYGIGTLAKNVAKLAAQFAKLPFRAFTSSIKSFANQSGKAALNSNALVKSLTSMKRLLITRIKRTFITAIFNGAKEALQQLAQFSSGFNAAMSNIKNASTQTAGNLAVALGGAIKTLEPMITGFINAINSAIVAVNKFFAMLGGKSSMVVAKKQTDDYAAILDKAGGAAKKASKQLYSFDEIERQQAEDAGGDADVDAGNLFEEMELGENLFNSWGEAFDNMLDAILSDGIPRLREGLLNFADWLNGTTGKVYEMFTFPGVVEKVQQIGRDLANAFNDMVNEINWYQLGQAIGAGLNLALQFLVNFIYTFDWINLGKKLANAVNGMVSEIDWYAVGKLLWSKFKIALETLAGFILGLDMKDLAKAASNIVKGFFDSMTETLENIPWYELGGKIIEFISNIDYNGISDSFFIALGSSFGAGVSVVYPALQNVIDSIKQYFADRTEEIGGNVVQGILYGMLKAWEGILTWIGEHIVKPFIDGFKKTFKIGSPSKVMEEQGVFVAQGILEGISKVFKDIKTWIKANITDPFINNVKSFFGISSNGSSVFAEIGTNLANGLKKGITDAWDSVITKAKGLADKVTSTVQNAFQVHSPSRVFAEIGEYLDAGLAEGIKGEENTVLKTVRNLAAAASGEMKSGNIGISAAGTNAAVEGFSNRIADGVYALVETLQAIADNVTFRVPNIAAGTVVPAGVAAVAASDGSAAYPKYGAYSAGQDYTAILSEILRLMQAGKTVKLNERSVLNLIYNGYNSEASRQGDSFIQRDNRGW